MSEVVEFAPQDGPQYRAFESGVDELLYGGAAFGGKTIWLTLDPLHYIQFPMFKAKIFRRTYPELNEIITYANEYYRALGAVSREGGLQWTFPSGATIRFYHMQEEMDWMKHAGESVPYFGFDELTTFTETQYTSILPWNRTRDPRIKPKLRATTNPWGPGLGWVYERFIRPVCDDDGLPTDAIQFITTMLPDSSTHQYTRQFIQAKYTDNEIGIKNNPGYVARLMEEPDPEKRKAYMEGSWDIRPGQFFSTFRDRVHVVADEKMAEMLRDAPTTKAGALDWGGSSTLCYLWGSRSMDTYFVEKEHYKDDLVGSQHVEMIKRRTPKDEWPRFTVCDPKLIEVRKQKNFAHNEMALADQFRGMGLPMRKAVNKHSDGYAAIRQMLYHTDTKKPSLYIAKSCENLIRELKQAERHDTNPDEIKDDGKYHAIATLRYLICHMMQPWVAENEDVPPDSWEAEFRKAKSERYETESVFAR